MKINGLVVAAGYGSFRNVDGQPFPKVLEEVGGVPMVVRAVRALTAYGLETAVVVNPVYDHSIREVLRAAGFRGEFVVQPRRTGSADAVRIALRCFDMDYVLVTYADMPLWSAETVAALVGMHRHFEPELSMATVRLSENAPNELRRYGRVIRDARGFILRVVEPDAATPEELAANTVNPSLFIWKARWFMPHVAMVPPAVKADGREPERHIPPLVSMLRAEGGRIEEMPLWNPLEALGVNSAYELERVRRVADSQNSGRSAAAGL